MKRIYIIVIAMGLVGASAAATKTKYKTQTWPVAVNCPACTALQVGHIQINFPQGALKKTMVLHANSASVHLIFNKPYYNGTRELGMLALTEQYGRESSVRKLYPKIGVKTTREMFIKLGKPETQNKTLRSLKDVYDVSIANQYIIYNGNYASAFFVDSNETERDILYIIPADIDKFVYKIYGELNEAVVQELLAHTTPATNP